MKNIRLVLAILILASLAPSLNTCGGENGIAEPTSIAVSPATATISVGATQQFTATGTFAVGPSGDITTHASWSSSDTTIATVSSNGLAIALAAGTVTITATVGVGDTESGPKRDILGRASTGIRADHCLNFPA